jgi:membrane protein implicated in regulation of membrane protease activity
MNFSITNGLIVLAVFVAFLFIARRVFRLALKLALVGALVAVLFVAAAVGWWRGWFDSASPTQRAVPQSNQRSNSNRRPASR